VLPLAVEVGLTRLREVLRALLTPVRLLLYLPARRRWRQLARAALAMKLDGKLVDLSTEIAADARVVIPIQPEARSLNLSVSAGIALWEGLRSACLLPSRDQE
jgi:hypothetical protein